MLELNQLVDSGSLLLSLITFTPLFGAMCLAVIRSGDDGACRSLSLFFSSCAFLFSLLLLVQFDPSATAMQFSEFKPWMTGLGVNYAMGVDGLSLWLVVLTTFLTVLVVAASTSVATKVRSYLACLLLLETGMIGAFLALDGITFYVFYELMLIPMYFLIGVWGGKNRVYAALKFFIYTAFGSQQ